MWEKKKRKKRYRFARSHLFITQPHGALRQKQYNKCISKYITNLLSCVMISKQPWNSFGSLICAALNITSMRLFVDTSDTNESAGSHALRRNNGEYISKPFVSTIHCSHSLLSTVTVLMHFKAQWGGNKKACSYAQKCTSKKASQEHLKPLQVLVNEHHLLLYREVSECSKSLENRSLR